MSCHNPNAECDGGMRPLSAERLLFIRRHFSEWSRCAAYVHDSGDTSATNCKHRLDESSALFAAPCLGWSDWTSERWDWAPDEPRCASC